MTKNREQHIPIHSAPALSLYVAQLAHSLAQRASGGEKGGFFSESSRSKDATGSKTEIKDL